MAGGLWLLAVLYASPSEPGGSPHRPPLRWSGRRAARPRDPARFHPALRTGASTALGAFLAVQAVGFLLWAWMIAWRVG